MKVDGKVGRGTRAPNSYPSSKLPEYIPPSEYCNCINKFDEILCRRRGCGSMDRMAKILKKRQCWKMNQIPSRGGKADDECLRRLSLKTRKKNDGSGIINIMHIDWMWIFDTIRNNTEVVIMTNKDSRSNNLFHGT